MRKQKTLVAGIVVVMLALSGTACEPPGEAPKAWGTADTIEAGDGTASTPQIAFDGSGNAIAVWYQHDGTYYSIYANRYQ